MDVLDQIYLNKWTEDSLTAQIVQVYFSAL